MSGPIPRIDPSVYAGKAVAKVLSAEESTELASCEALIVKGFASFVEVGNALIKISNGRLYRATHSSFQDYCSDKWQMSARRAYQLCEAAEVVASVNNCSQIANEGQARELAKVAPAKRAAVLKKASKAGPPTAKAIKAVVDSGAVAQSGSASVATSAQTEPERKVAGSNPAGTTISLKAIKLALREVLLALDRPPVDFDVLADKLEAYASALRSPPPAARAA